MNNNEKEGEEGLSPKYPVTMFTEMEPGALVQIQKTMGGMRLSSTPEVFFRFSPTEQNIFNNGTILMFLAEEIIQIHSPAPNNPFMDYLYVLWFLAGDKKLCWCEEWNSCDEFYSPSRIEATVKKYFEVIKNETKSWKII